MALLLDKVLRNMLRKAEICSLASLYMQDVSPSSQRLLLHFKWNMVLLLCVATCKRLQRCGS